MKLLLFTLLLPLLPSLQSLPATPQSLPATPAPLVQSEPIIGMRVNNERIKHGLKPLIYNPRLSLIAKCRAGYLDETQVFTHEGWLDCFDKYPPNNGLIGENLAEVILPEYDYFNAWMLSESHRDNVLEPRYTRYGIATKGRYTAITFSE